MSFPLKCVRSSRRCFCSMPGSVLCLTYRRRTNLTQPSGHTLSSRPPNGLLVSAAMLSVQQVSRQCLSCQKRKPALLSAKSVLISRHHLQKPVCLLNSRQVTNLTAFTLQLLHTLCLYKFWLPRLQSDFNAVSQAKLLHQFWKRLLQQR